jgi:hypothetical protein
MTVVTFTINLRTAVRRIVLSKKKMYDSLIVNKRWDGRITVFDLTKRDLFQPDIFARALGAWGRSEHLCTQTLDSGSIPEAPANIHHPAHMYITARCRLC